MQQTLPEIKIPEIKCQGKHRARLSCIDAKCDQKAFICLKDQCNFCQSNHKQCKTGWIDSIVQKIIQKRLLRTPGLDEAILTTEKIYNQAFQLVQRQRDGFKAQIENYGLNFDEITLLENLQKGKTDQIVGKSVHGAFRELQDVCLFQRDQQALMAYWEAQAKKIQQIFQRLKLLRKSVGITQIKSSILKKFEQKMTLQSFFSYPIVGANLLFRASQHDFEAKTFHQICDGIPNTLTIAITQFGKIVGGFTTIPWNKDCIGTTQYSQQSFLFSITNKEKYKFFSYENCTFGQPDFGPTFGSSENGGYDLNIPTKSNSKNFGVMQLGSTYQKPKNVQNLAKHLIGSDSLAKVKFMEWQVFEIQFLNPEDLLNKQKNKKSQFEGKTKTVFGTKRTKRRLQEEW